MEKKPKKQVSVGLTVTLIFVLASIFGCAVMGILLYRGKNRIAENNNEIASLKNTVSSLSQTISEMKNTVVSNDATVSNNTSVNSNTVESSNQTVNNDVKSAEQTNLTTSSNVTDLSVIKNMIKTANEYDYFSISNVTNENGKYLVNAERHVPITISEAQYSKMTKDKKIILEDKEYIYSKDGVDERITEVNNQGYQYQIKKSDNGYMFFGPAGQAYLENKSANYKFYLETNTEVRVEFGIEELSGKKDLTIDNTDISKYSKRICYDSEKDKLYISINPL